MCTILWTIKSNARRFDVYWSAPICKYLLQIWSYYELLQLDTICGFAYTLHKFHRKIQYRCRNNNRDQVVCLINDHFYSHLKILNCLAVSKSFSFELATSSQIHSKSSNYCARFDPSTARKLQNFCHSFFCSSSFNFSKWLLRLFQNFLGMCGALFIIAIAFRPSLLWGFSLSLRNTSTFFQ